MENLIADVSHISFEINDQLENQVGLVPLPFNTMNSKLITFIISPIQKVVLVLVSSFSLAVVEWELGVLFVI